MPQPSRFWCTVLLQILVVHLTTSAATLNPVSLPGNGELLRTCPLQETRDTVIESISTSVLSTLSAAQDLFSFNCGPGLWHQIAHLNMSNSSQHCPPAWREYSDSGVRGCRRPQTSVGSCPATFYPTGRQYSQVCGRAIGYQYGTVNAFGFSAVGQDDIDTFYVYGVSITHGSPRNHIWTLAGGISEGAHTTEGWDCPCSNLSSSDNNNVPSPSFVGNDYYCESGNPTNIFQFDQFYPSDPLWDGQQCEGQCCSPSTDGQSPPWFTVELPNPTTDDIEVRICIPEQSQDDIVIQLLELYVQ